MKKLRRAFYDKEIYNNKLFKMMTIVSNKAVIFRDVMIDKKVCKMSLQKYVPSKYRESHGATGSSSTSYSVVKSIVDINKLNDNSKFIDVGCGKGRVLASLIHRGVKCKMVGIELNEEVAEIAKSWAKNYDNIEIRCENAFEVDMSEYTDIFLARPFENELFKKYIEKLESELTHETNIYFYVDQLLGDFLDDREGWNLEKRGISYFKKGFFLSYSPQRYSVYKYIPNK
ncbi:MAG: class I SAM-dependent methyltransferase [Eubacterium sp.]|nr:class I SAM-dependent methyltransferase [Eubacterium sp.]